MDFSYPKVQKASSLCWNQSKYFSYKWAVYGNEIISISQELKRCRSAMHRKKKNETKCVSWGAEKRQDNFPPTCRQEDIITKLEIKRTKGWMAHQKKKVWTTLGGSWCLNRPLKGRYPLILRSGSKVSGTEDNFAP